MTECSCTSCWTRQEGAKEERLALLDAVDALREKMRHSVMPAEPGYLTGYLRACGDLTELLRTRGSR